MARLKETQMLVERFSQVPSCAVPVDWTMSATFAKNGFCFYHLCLPDDTCLVLLFRGAELHLPRSPYSSLMT